jgi:hypothetical protein
MATIKRTLSKYLFGWQLVVGVACLAAVLVATQFTQPALHRLSSNAQQPATTGDVVRYEVREDSGSTAVNAVHVKGTYSTDDFEFLGVDGVGSSFAIATEGDGPNGTFSIARGTIDSVRGDHLVAKLLLKRRTPRAKPPVVGDNTILVETDNTANIFGQPGVKVYLKEVK